MNLEETFDEQKAIGMTLSDAAAFFAEYGYLVRVVRNNGAACIITRDYRQDRINVALQDGRISEIKSIG